MRLALALLFALLPVNSWAASNIGDLDLSSSTINSISGGGGGGGPSGAVDSGNSTSAPLADGGSFVGTGADVLNQALITVFLHGEPSTSSGTLFMEFSTDNTNWDRSIRIDVTNPSTAPPHSLIPVAQYFRVRYFDSTDGTAMTALRLQTVFHTAKSKGLTSRVNQVIDDQTDVDNVRAVIVGKDEVTGAYINIASVGTALAVSNVTFQPPGTSPVGDEDIGDLDSDEERNNDTTITNGETWVIQELIVSCSPVSEDKYMKVEFSFRPNGNATGEERLATVFCNSDSFHQIIFPAIDRTGDGTADIRMRLEQVNGVEMDVHVEWVGYQK